MCDVLLPPGVNPTAVIYIYIYIYISYQNEMVGACRTWLWGENLSEREDFGDVGVDGSIILNGS
jgi:hypothetical protein